MPENILVRGVNWIGDAVMTMPALRALRKAFPDARISLLVKPSVAAIFEKDPDIDEFIIYENRHRGFLGKLKFAYSLRRRGFTKAVLLQNAFDAALIAFLAGIPERIGYDRDGRGFLLTKPIAFSGDDRKVHHIDYYLNLISHLSPPGPKLQSNNPTIPPLEKGGKGGFERTGVAEILPWIHLSVDERLSARDKLSQLKRPVLGINPGAAYGSAKRWLPERFAEVAEWFIKDTDGSAVIFGGPQEIEIADEIFKCSKKLRAKSFERETKEYSEQNSSLVTRHSLLSLAGKTSVRELIALISECDVVVSNDSGPMHIAYAVGAPLVAIFGSTSPELTGPAGEGNRVVMNHLTCSPCFDRVCKGNDTACMTSIASEDVFFKVKELSPFRKAVFFDRDGTLCRDADYLNDWDDFEVSSEIGVLQGLKKNGFLLVGVSNQSGIARGFVSESFVNKVNNVFIEEYGFDDFYYCPHHPDEHCPCRKPEPLMLLNARAKHKINLKESYVVGDKESDMLLAKAVGATGILVLTGRQKESANADFIAKDLKEAADFIIRNSNA